MRKTMIPHRFPFRKPSNLERNVKRRNRVETRRIEPFGTPVAPEQQGSPSASRAGVGRTIATVSVPLIYLAVYQARTYHHFVHAHGMALTMGHSKGPVHRGTLYRSTSPDTAMTSEAHGGTAVIQNDADTTSVHSGNDSWRWKRPLDVVMTTQPSFRRRLAEAQGSVMRTGRCRRETSPSSRAIESLHVGDVGLERGSRARVGPMH